MNLKNANVDHVTGIVTAEEEAAGIVEMVDVAMAIDEVMTDHEVIAITIETEITDLSVPEENPEVRIQLDSSG